MATTKKTTKKTTNDAIMPLECGDCGHQWTEHFDLPMSVAQFVQRTRAVSCSVCGSKKALMRPMGSFYRPDDPIPKWEEPAIPAGEKRAYTKCGTCGEPFYYDYVPYGLGSPIMTLRCGHGATQARSGLVDISQREFLERMNKLMADPKFFQNKEVKDGTKSNPT